MSTNWSGAPARRLQCGVRDVRFGKDVTIVEPCNLYECTVGEGSFVGPFVEVQEGATIGRNTRIQSHAFVCSKVSIGDDCFIGHGVMFTNDKFADGRVHEEASAWMPTNVGDRVLIGSGATILPVNICSDVVIGAGATVTKNITEPGKYVGVPAQRLSEATAR